jgi:hypothetical protein
MWFRYIIIGMLSFTALQMFLFQAINIYQAFWDYFKQQ